MGLSLFHEASQGSVCGSSILCRHDRMFVFMHDAVCMHGAMDMCVPDLCVHDVFVLLTIFECTMYVLV